MSQGGNFWYVIDFLLKSFGNILISLSLPAFIEVSDGEREMKNLTERQCKQVLRLMKSPVLNQFLCFCLFVCFPKDKIPFFHPFHREKAIRRKFLVIITCSPLLNDMSVNNYSFFKKNIVSV